MTTKKGKIAHDLREDIVQGVYSPGDLLPSIPELMAKYGAARDTIRDAISMITHEGLVTPQRGRGTVVREIDPVNLAYAATAQIKTWQDQTSGAGKDEVVEAEWEGADVEIAARLGIKPGDMVLRRVRHFTKGHGVAQVTEQWFPERVVKAVKEATGGDLSDLTNRADRELNLFELLAAAGLPPKSTTETLSSRMPDPEERDAMEIPPGVPVLVTRRVTSEEDKKAVETTTAIGAADRMSATFTVALNY